MYIYMYTVYIYIYSQFIEQNPTSCTSQNQINQNVDAGDESITFLTKKPTLLKNKLWVFTNL